MIRGRIQLEPNLREEQLVKLYVHYKKEQEEEIRWAHNHPLWKEAKEVVELMREDILKQMKAKIINPNKLTEELG